jgi:hypothetical protein
MKDEKLNEMKRKLDIIEKSELDEGTKTVGKMGAAMGVDNDSLIHGMVAAASAKEHEEIMKNTPPQKKFSGYTPIQRSIAEMLTEDTGSNIMDSGGAYGRAFQKNRKIQDFRKIPDLEVEGGHNDGEFILHKPLFPYLTNHLTVSPESRELQREFKRFMKQNEDDGWLSNMEEFAKLNDDEDTEGRHGVDNTYNYDNLLGGTLQYASFTNKGKEFLILQIHGGADVRGGYTEPHVFELSEGLDYFIIDQTDARALVENPKGQTDINGNELEDMMYYSDDSGYHWYADDRDVAKDEDSKAWRYDPAQGHVVDAAGRWVHFDGEEAAAEQPAVYVKPKNQKALAEA